MSWSTVSKAFLRSMNTPQDSNRWLMFVCISLTMSSIAGGLNATYESRIVRNSKVLVSICCELLRSRYENVTPNFCWVLCALIIGYPVQLKREAFWDCICFDTNLLTFASLWRANSRGDSCVLGVHFLNVCWYSTFEFGKRLSFKRLLRSATQSS